jgi:hypothetical protein
MSYSFEYIDIILLAMIAGFIFLRLRGILGKRTGFEGKASPQLGEVLKSVKPNKVIESSNNFDEEAQKEFLKGAKIAYETIITDFSANDSTNRSPINSLGNDSIYQSNYCFIYFEASLGYSANTTEPSLNCDSTFYYILRYEPYF